MESPQQRLDWSIQSNYIVGVSSALAEGADPNFSSSSTRHPLFVAVVPACRQITDALLQAGAKPEKMFDGATYDQIKEVFFNALFKGAAINFEMLLDHWPAHLEGWNTNWMDGQHPLHICAQKALRGRAVSLIKFGASPDVQDHEGKTPAHKAEAPLLQVLFSHGARCDIPDHKGITPLCEAVGAGMTTRHFDPLRVAQLIDGGVNPCLDPKLEEIYKDTMESLMSKHFPFASTCFREAQERLYGAMRPWILREHIKESVAIKDSVTTLSNKPKM